MIGSIKRPLVVWDVDGTLVDSRATIRAATEAGFRKAGRTPPCYDEIRQIVGLNLKDALARLAPDMDAVEREALLDGYKEHFWALHSQPGFKEPLYQGAAETLDRLRAQGWRIAMATGKSRRGVETILRMHDWADLFASTHCADDGPGKPHPAMLIEAMRVLEADPAETVMVGDTCHDMSMARAAGVRALGVSWGFQTAEEIAVGGADHISHSWDELNAALDLFAAERR
jgi:phosphoglycolate phosphatase